VNHLTPFRLLLFVLNLYSGVRVRVRALVRVRVRVRVLVRVRVRVRVRVLVLVLVLLCRLDSNKNVPFNRHLCFVELL
jgi:hypothetical protein